MKRELKNILPYLPYGLKWRVDTSYSDWENHSISEPTEVSIEYGTISFNFDTFEIHDITIDPILRPMSDLRESSLRIALGLYTKPDIDFCVEDPTSMSYTDVNLLIANHFDVFGLIKEHLALDINLL